MPRDLCALRRELQQHGPGELHDGEQILRGMRPGRREEDLADLQGDAGEDLKVLLVNVEDTDAGPMAELLEEVREHRVLIRLALNFVGRVDEVETPLDCLTRSQQDLRSSQ